MMRFDVITIFPSFFEEYFSKGILHKGCEKGLLEVNVHDLRDWTTDKHRTVDDACFGEGSGMVMKVGPIYRAVSDIKLKNKKSLVVLFTPRGKKFNQKKASKLTEYDQVIMICGRYEGVDERVAKHIADEKISIGSFVLMGGEIPAMAVVETVARLVPGVIGKESFLKERKKKESFIEYPQYTRPEVFEADEKKWKVPSVLLSGNHKEVEKWKNKKGKLIK
ncbi:MAG: tRNA (guanosine(37)-N1)-methyltransferase TrmD [Candidatus Pacebacteria bacterium]|nr:tRNA (guanosine(37)-N1)-methyltransferase TrmD [Candidatus Paceibacterota bacterium]